jgi:hypothetical protein
VAARVVTVRAVDAGVPARPRIRGTVAGRRTAAVIVCFVVAAVAGVLLATALGSQRYLLLMPLHTWLARAIVATASPLLLGVAWFLTKRGRRATIACVVTTVLLQIVGLGAGAAALFLSNVESERPIYGPEVFAVSPQGRFELVRAVYEYPIWRGDFEAVKLRSRAGLASRESVMEVLRCGPAYQQFRDVFTYWIVTAEKVSFVDETTIRVKWGGPPQFVRFDAETLRIDHTVVLEHCPHRFDVTVPP